MCDRSRSLAHPGMNATGAARGAAMNPISSAGATALHLLQHAANLNRAGSGAQKTDLASIASGASLSVPAQPNATDHPIDDMFSVQFVDLNKMKVNLMERLGKELGVSFEDFENASEFGREVQRIVSQIKLKEDGYLEIKRIEEDLGLDKLGISLDDFIKAIIDPKSTEAERLDAALLREVGLDKSVNHESGAGALDDIGIYSQMR